MQGCTQRKQAFEKKGNVQNWLRRLKETTGTTSHGVPAFSEDRRLSKLEGGQGRGVGMSRNWVIKGVEQSISGGGAGESRVAFLMEEQLGFLEEI